MQIQTTDWYEYMGNELDGMSQDESQPTLYQILGLKRSSATPAQIKLAYRRALLQHHPDKNGTSLSANTRFTVDEVTRARQILLDPRLKAEYDQSLLIHGEAKDRSSLPLNPTELEVVDLDDLAFNEATGQWSKQCRCGNMSGYGFTEADLEEEMDAKLGSGNQRGEILVGCGDCSLYIRVMFEALDG